jgi:hypothetical protein
MNTSAHARAHTPASNGVLGVELSDRIDALTDYVSAVVFVSRCTTAAEIHLIPVKQSLFSSEHFHIHPGALKLMLPCALVTVFVA